MAALFDITALSTNVSLDKTKRRGEAAFTVTNRAGRTIRGRAEPRALNPVAQPWLTVLEDAERKFPAGGVQSYMVEILVPPGAPKGEYIFRFDMVDVADTDETRVEGPTLTFSVPEPIVKPFPWWIVAVVLGLIVLIAIIWGVSRSGTPVPTEAPPTVPPIITRTPPPFVNRQFVDFDGSQYVGDLVEQWDVSKDGIEWVFYLIPGPILASGDDFNAITAQKILDTSAGAGKLPGYAFSEPIDDWTLRIVLNGTEYSDGFLNSLSRIDFSTFPNR